MKCEIAVSVVELFAHAVEAIATLPVLKLQKWAALHFNVDLVDAIYYMPRYGKNCIYFTLVDLSSFDSTSNTQ